MDSTLSQKDRKIIERRQENFVKNFQSEFTDTYQKIKYFFSVKLEKNWKRLNEKLNS